MDRATRHFQELMGSPDDLVGAWSAERDFLCAFIVKQCVPVHKKSAKNETLDTPYHALCWLRYTFKCLSVRMKKAAARNENDLIFIRAWYGDTLQLAHAQVQQHVALTAAEAWRNVPSSSMTPSERAPKRRSPDGPSLPDYKPVDKKPK